MCVVYSTRVAIKVVLEMILQHDVWSICQVEKKKTMKDCGPNVYICTLNIKEFSIFLYVPLSMNA